MHANHNNIECPCCGAPLQQRHFMMCCPYCGHYESVEGIEDIGQIDNDTTSMCYDYITHNEPFIRRSGFVHLDITHDQSYRLLSQRPFSPNNGKWVKINDLSISIIYTNDSSEDHLLFSVAPDKLKTVLSPFFAISLNDEYVIQPKLIDTVEKSYYFEVKIIEFNLICMASEVDVSTNLIDSSLANFREFKTFCCRFYNQVFDRTKYTYSLNTRLITDNF